MKEHQRKNRVLIFVVAYDAESTVRDVIDRIPSSLQHQHHIHLLIVDDCSGDKTALVAKEHLEKGFWCEYEVLRNPVNQGYGGNQKIGYLYAAQNDYHLVAMLHGDGQYAPEMLPELLEPFLGLDPPGAVFGSRMLNRRDALKGGMPLYKFVGNRILTRIQNWLLGSSLSEFHTGYRVYSVPVLQKLPLELNTNDFHFDTEIIVQLFLCGVTIKELPIKTFYGEEVCHVDGLKYALDVIKASVKARLMRMGIFFDPKFAPQNNQTSHYVNKLDFASTHSVAFREIKENSVVLDLGCAEGFLSESLVKEKACKVISCDLAEHKDLYGCSYISCNLNEGLPDVNWNDLDYVVFLDVIEHLDEPELFLKRLRSRLSNNDRVQIITSTGNVCFFVTRVMMMLGQFNYGRRGILDITHKRLFSVKSFRRILKYAAYNVEKHAYIPAPYPLAIGLNRISGALLSINGAFARILPGVFAYQTLFIAEAKPATDWLLQKAREGGLLTQARKKTEK